MKSEKVIDKVKNISLNLYLPYTWQYVRSLEPRGYSLKDYGIIFKDSNGCAVNVNMEKANFKNVSLEQLTDVLNDFTSIF